ncbi:diguanylate cyclase/phosphodiesterase with PAS/PAC sensor(s) [Psychromonas ingrahamii 37]|uniref:Diguanylate cyclase/phosphodiesterase with PAS/PAC sensor(S) n=1 Tax=Psychromonas ingrahamii (strain DSM 17664 / CCUG 51855 / 37) TaxID=357804 RepID=A1SWA5_PSYIN|nr:GGDEF domain-containing phosphodiesterase [Psychromonas ingrahamii]ABM03770.1 diguanylate cyclase/phosphodiesterase with PAS/PAC sensor(s) [Psychromonas ingrahamii 37]
MSNKTPQINNQQDDNNARLELVINATGVGIWDWQVQTGELTFNKRWAEIIGYTFDELQPIQFDSWASNLHPDDLVKAKSLLAQHFNGEIDFYELEARMKHKSGHYVWVLASGKLVERDEQGKPKRMIGTHLDINERKNNEELMIVTSQLLNESQQIGRLGGWKLDLKTGDLFWTDETYRIHETSPEEFNPTVDAGIGYFLPDSQKIISKALDEAINNGIGYDLELQTYTTKGRKIDVRTTCIVTQEDGVAVRLTGIFQDISEQKANQRKLEKSNLDLANANSALKLSAHYDPLTGLPNRILLADRIQQAVAKSLRNDKYVAVAFIDLDGFKAVNDSHGHTIGDELLKKVAKRLKHVLREGDTLSRFGGDEFVAVIDNLSDPRESDLIVLRMLESVSSTLVVEKKLLKISASIGVTFYPLDSAGPEQLLRHADQAMYMAKQQGKNRSYVFDIEQDVAIKHHNEALKRIAQALKNNEFALYYQPKTDLRSNRVVGVEALIRWNHPDRGVLAPAMFLPAVEHDILDIEIGKWVIKTALQQSQNWLSSGTDIPISVNISPLHLQHAEFVSELKRMLDQYPNINAGSLEFEILESSALKDIELVSKVMKECNQLGVRFSIDDFGTGYSSLTYLKRLPAETLKIDQSFVRDMLIDTDDKAIIQGIIELAKVFNLKVIAEGVETPQHGELLLSLGCYFVQGYGIAKPMHENDVLTWLVKWEKTPCLVDGRV